MIAAEPAKTPALSVLSSFNFEDWDERETWALEDNVRRFSIEDGRYVLWRRLALEVPELLQRSPKELRARWLALEAPRERGAPASWEDLPCLEEWECVAHGKFRGELHGLEGVRDGSLSVTVEHDGESAAASGTANTVTDVYAEQWCVRTRMGEYFQLGRPAELAAEPDEPTLTSLVPKQIEDVPAAAVSAAGAAAGAAGQLAPPLLVGSALLAASAAIGVAILGHVPHVDVSVFIV